jgi:hypothetical protein
MLRTPRNHHVLPIQASSSPEGFPLTIEVCELACSEIATDPDGHVVLSFRCGCEVRDGYWDRCDQHKRYQVATYQTALPMVFPWE